MKGTLRFLFSTGFWALAIAVVALDGPAARAASIPGTASVSGVVDSSRAFHAAQVYFRNPEKRMLYMVYTVGGRYQAMQLLPGNYEVSVATKGLQNLASDTSKLMLKAGQQATMNLSLHEVASNKKPIDYL